MPSIPILGPQLSTNFAPNPCFQFWQAIEATPTTIPNGIQLYGPDQWFAKNGLGTNGVLTIQQNTAALNQSLFQCQLKITTAPTAAQANGCELYCVLSWHEVQGILNQVCSAAAQVKALGNVTQVGIQFVWGTTSNRPTTTIGAETLVTVNSSTFTLAKAINQTLSQATIGATGNIGFRIRITGVSSGNTYDINNGFLVELPQINVGVPTVWTPRFADGGFGTTELHALQQFYWKTFTQGQAPVTNGGLTNCLSFPQIGASSAGAAYGPFMFPVYMLRAPTVTLFNPSIANAQVRNVDKNADMTSSSVNQAGPTSFGISCVSPASSTVGFQCVVHAVADARL